MMVETILESSQDFGMSNVVLPQWKRELLQRRAARQRPALPPTPPPPPPPPPPPISDDDEELRYGPGHVKRLKSRYLSLAHREPPRRRPSVLRRATSLEHLLDERPPPVPRPHIQRQTRPISVATTPTATIQIPRRELVKRARSVDALSRLESREEIQPPSPPPIAPRPPVIRAARPPRRPTPLLRETERPPPDVVRSTLRKFETAPTRRTAPAARVSAVLRGFEGNQPRSSTPEPRGRSPSPASADLSAIDEPEGAVISVETKHVSRAALEGIARAGSSVRYSFEAPHVASHLPPLAATNPVLLNRVRQSASPRRIGVIRPMPAPTLEHSTSAPAPFVEDIIIEKVTKTATMIVTSPANVTASLTANSPPIATPPSPVTTPSTLTSSIISSPTIEIEPALPICLEKRESPLSAVVEPIPRTPPEERSLTEKAQAELPLTNPPNRLETSPEPLEMKIESVKIETTKPEPLINGHVKTDRLIESKVVRLVESKVDGTLSRNSIIETKCSVNGTSEKIVIIETKVKKENGEVKCESAPWTRVGSPGAARKTRSPAPATTSVVFNFSNRKEVPDYIENDGLILRGSRRNKFKAGESGIVVLRPEALVKTDSDSEGEDCGPPSPCGVRFINDNVLINGRSSMPTRPNKDRIAKLKLQFDDSLTRTFEYPSETSLCEDSPAAPLATNTHIASAALARYTPSKTLPDDFQLGVTRHLPDHSTHANNGCLEGGAGATCGAQAQAEEAADADVARSWSEARSTRTDLLF